MIKKIADKSLEELFYIRKIVADCSNNVLFCEYPTQNITANSSFVKYTSINTQYKMLDSDSLLVFCSELSNDLSENKAVRDVTPQDTYISSFYLSDRTKCNASDVYSQWMSYCKDGGVAFEFYFGQDIIGNSKNLSEKEYSKHIKSCFENAKQRELNTFNYSLICNDAKDDSDYYLYPNFPFQVQYYDNLGKNDEFPINEMVKASDATIEELLPFFKHSGFVQESEARLAFVNINNRLAKCIKFIDKKDGTKIPYIEVKFGDLDNNKKPCDYIKIASDMTIEDAITKDFENKNPFSLIQQKPIIIPQGRDQEEIYNTIESVLNKIDPNLLKQHKINIICQGHLPITKITVAPTNDRREQKKKLEIYCKSKYWLRNVEICESQIPYNTVNNNHT